MGTKKYIQKLSLTSGILTTQERENINRIFDVLYWISPILNPGVGTIEPPSQFLRAGMLAYADGTNWNPGSGGEGYYFYTVAGAWQKLD